MPHGRDVNDLCSLSSSSVERLLASQSILNMSHSRDQLHHYQRHPSSFDFAHGQVNANTHWATPQSQQRFVYPPPQQQQTHLAQQQLHMAQMLQQQAALNNDSAIPGSTSSQRSDMQTPAIQLHQFQQYQQQGLAHQAFASSMGAPPTNPLLPAYMQQQNAHQQNFASQGNAVSVADPRFASLLHQQHARLQQEQQPVGQALGMAQSNPSSLAASGNASLADPHFAVLFQQQQARLQQGQHPTDALSNPSSVAGSQMIPNLFHQQSHPLNGAVESPRQFPGSAPSPSAEGNSDGET